MLMTHHDRCSKNGSPVSGARLSEAAEAKEELTVLPLPGKLGD